MKSALLLLAMFFFGTATSAQFAEGEYSVGSTSCNVQANTNTYGLDFLPDYTIKWKKGTGKTIGIVEISNEEEVYMILNEYTLEKKPQYLGRFVFTDTFRGLVTSGRYERADGKIFKMTR